MDEPGPEPAGTATGAGPSPWWERSALVVLGAVTALLAVRAVLSPWVPVSDNALIEMAVRDVPGHLPLMGAYSRLGWRHPGPAQFLLYALPYRLAGSRSGALMATTLVLHAGGVAAAWWMARRIHRLAAALLLLALSLVLLAADPAQVRSPWNPYVGLVLTATALTAAWSLAERRRAGAVVLLPLVTLLVQAHVGYAAVAAAAVAAGVVGALVGRDRTEPLPWRAGLVGAALAALMWVPPLVEQLRGGNLGDVVRYAFTGDEPAAGLGLAARVMSQQYAWWPEWAGGGADPGLLYLPSWAVPVLLVVVVAGVAAAVVRRSGPLVRGLAVALVAQLAALVGASRIRGQFNDYLMVYRWSIAAMALALAVAALVELRPSWSAPAVRVASVLATVGLLATGVVQWVVEDPEAGAAPAALAAADAIESRSDGGPVVVGTVSDFQGVALWAATVLQMEKRGVPVRVTRRSEGADMTSRFGAHRTSDSPARFLVARPNATRLLVEQGWVPVGGYQPLTRRQQAELDRLEAERAALGDPPPGSAEAGLSGAERLARIAALDRRSEVLLAGRTPFLVFERRG
ncbi:MAG: hypothetical protein ACOYOP_06870 [Microthrixaceae bacterium]